MKHTTVCCGIGHDRSDRDFTHIHNEIIRDRRIDFATRGVFLSLWSLPDDWEFSIEGLRITFGGSPGMWVRTIRKLSECCYIRKEIVRMELTGKGKENLKHHFRYILCDNPSKTVKNPIVQNMHNGMCSEAVGKEDEDGENDAINEENGAVNCKSVRDYGNRNYGNRNYENRQQLSTNSTNNGSNKSGGGEGSDGEDGKESKHQIVTRKDGTAFVRQRRGLGGVRKVERPTDEEFMAWLKRAVKLFSLTTHDVSACLARYHRALDDGWRDTTGVEIANWKLYFGTLLRKQVAKAESENATVLGNL